MQQVMNYMLSSLQFEISEIAQSDSPEIQNIFSYQSTSMKCKSLL